MQSILQGRKGFARRKPMKPKRDFIYFIHINDHFCRTPHHFCTDINRFVWNSFSFFTQISSCILQGGPLGITSDLQLLHTPVYLRSGVLCEICKKLLLFFQRYCFENSRSYVLSYTRNYFKNLLATRNFAEKDFHSIHPTFFKKFLKNFD